jgi:hypothetical protein
MYEEDNTVGEDVDRHCKIRFVEKAITIIAGAEDSTPMNMEDSWSIPTMVHQNLNASDEGAGSGTHRGQEVGEKLSSNGGSSTHGAESVKQEQEDGLEKSAGSDSLVAKLTGDDGKQKISLGNALNPLEFLDDNQLGSMDDDQLDNVLDSLLIR